MLRQKDASENRMKNEVKREQFKREVAANLARK